MPTGNRVATAVLGAMLVAGAAVAGETGPCPGNYLPPLVLPHVKQAIASNQEVTIVALGSSSTQGVHASDIGHSYPSILQTELTKAFPGSHFVVLNRGIGGQDATEELARLEHDALSVGPALVIWQVGANGAMGHADPAVFADQVSTGVTQIADAQADVVLMDNQRSPMVMASPLHAQFEQALGEVAQAQHVGLFERGRLMDEWKSEGYPYAEFVSEDGVHHNDHGYACVAKALAHSIAAGLGRSSPMQIANVGATIRR